METQIQALIEGTRTYWTREWFAAQESGDQARMDLAVANLEFADAVELRFEVRS